MFRKYLGIRKSTSMKIIIALLWVINLGLIIAHFLGDGPFPIVLFMLSVIVTIIVNKRIKSNYYD